jgi:hypothetical protein
MNQLTTTYLGIMAIVAAGIAAMPAEASLTADGVTYTLLEATTANPQVDQLTLNIAGINGPLDTEGGRYGVQSLAFTDPVGFITAAPPGGFTFEPGGLNSNGCNGTGNFFCFNASTTPTGPALAADSGLSFNFTVTATNLPGWDPDFKIDWVGTQNNYDLVSLPLAPETQQAPEIDPSSATAALTLLAGGLAVIRGRRRKK